jgi:hypothetical protein
MDAGDAAPDPRGGAGVLGELACSLCRLYIAAQIDIDRCTAQQWIARVDLMCPVHLGAGHLVCEKSNFLREKCRVACKQCDLDEAKPVVNNPDEAGPIEGE